MYHQSYCVSSCIEVGRKRYFVPSNLNFFVVYNTYNKKTQLYQIERENFLQERLYSQVIYHNNKAYFIPLNAQNFLCVELTTYHMEYIEIPFRKEFNTKYGYFSGGYLVGECIYATGVRYPGIIKWDLRSGAVKVLGDKEFNTAGIQFGFTTVCNGEKIIMTIGETNKIFMLDTGTDQVEVISLENASDHQFDCVCGEQEFCWFLDNKNWCLVEWNMVTNQVKQIKIGVFQELFGKKDYLYIKFRKGQLFLFTDLRRSGPVIVHDIKSQNFITVWLNEWEKTGFVPWGIYEDDSFIYVSDYLQQETYQINVDNYEVSRFDLEMDGNKILEKIFSLYGSCVKEGSIHIELFLDYLVAR